MDKIIDKIDQVYENMNIHRAILVCDDQAEVETMMALLESRNYPCANTYTPGSREIVRMLVVTYVSLLDDYLSPILNETTVLFTLDDSVVGDLCALAQDYNINLVVSLTK